MNVYDSERMSDVLAPLGYAATASPADADMVILNTCHIRDRAAEKVFSELGRLRKVKDERAAAGQADHPGRRRLRRPGRGRRDRRPRPVRRHRAGPANLPPPARDGGPRRPRRRRRDRDRLPGRGQVRPPARSGGAPGRHRLPHGAGRLRQVLLVLRRALHPRRRGQPPGAADPGRGAPAGGLGAREITLLGQNVNAWHGDAATAARPAWAACSRAWPTSRGCCASATPPRTPATWTTT